MLQGPDAVISSLAFVACAAVLPQQCGRCDDTGLEVCREHDPKRWDPEEEPSKESPAIRCTLAAQCGTCRGTLMKKCKACTRGPEEHADPAGAAGDAVAAWAAERRKLEEKLGRDEDDDPLLHMESAHFRLLWNAGRIKVGRKTLDVHASAHMTLRRMEALYEEFCELTGLPGVHTKADLYLFDDVTDQAFASLAWTGNTSRTGSKRMGSMMVFSLYRDPGRLGRDEDLHRSLRHNVTHLLLSNAGNQRWVGNVRGGWMDAGLAHVMEERLDGLCTNFCYQEQNSGIDFRGGRWKKAVRSMCKTRQWVPLATVMGRNTNTLTAPEHAQAFSIVEFLLSRGADDFARVVGILKEKRPAREALREVYDENVLEFEQAWRAWVLATYSSR